MFISDHITSRIQIYRYLLKVSFLATALLSILSFHWNFHDGQIVEKWIWSGITFCITIFLITLFSLSIHKEKDRLNNCIEIMAYTFLLAGLVVIIQSLLQVTGITSVNNTTEHRIIAGFDNPAGVWRCLQAWAIRCLYIDPGIWLDIAYIGSWIHVIHVQTMEHL